MYEVYDRERQGIVALKTLRQVDPAALYRFKKEFRALADVSHPNLVQLYELLNDGERWFFTMELVKGRTWSEFLFGTEPSRHGSTEDRTPTVIHLDPEEELSDESGSPEPFELPANPELLRGTLRQLVRGLIALHGAGKLHCDLKPSNVLLRRDGRLVLVDLGLVRDLMAQRIYESLEDDIVGTPAYMSPEQAAGLRVTEASDWYSVGVMLYEALTGRLPYTGTVMKILTDKQKLDPPAPVTLAPDVPEDLSALCLDLLQREPTHRPKGPEILERLGEGSDEPDPMPLGSSAAAAPFIGRQRHLEVLEQAFKDSRRGRTVALFVHGTSGMGKSALVHRFLEDLHLREEDTVVLAGRCFQRESMPFKAFDSMIDTLSRYLRRLPRHEAAVLLPYNVLALARLFPVLLRVKAVAEAKRRVLEIPDSGELRRRAFSALRELFLRLSDRHPLVLFIDDLQWGDLDSAALLQELLRPPDPPPLLLIACFRSEEVLTSPLLRTFFSTELTRAATEVRELAVRELEPEEGVTLARRLLGESSDTAVPGAQTLAATIAREAGGNPFFIDALVRYAQAVVARGKSSSNAEAEEPREVGKATVERAVGEATVERAVLARLERLPPEARRLLGVLAVAGRPLPLSVAATAALIEEELQSALAALRALQLVRMRGARDAEEIEPYHDRIRQVVLGSMSPERSTAYHRSLARTLQTSGAGDPETLARHFREAGDYAAAAHYASQAADRAVEALAFDRAARLYREAVDLNTDRQRLPELKESLADALANAGRGAEAAQIYLAAADDAPESRALELRRRAAEQFLISGRIDKGLATVRHVLRNVGIELPATPARAKTSLLWRRLRLRLRGLRYRPRLAEEIPVSLALRIDTCWAVSVGLGLVDPIRGMDFGTRALLLALDSGDLYRIARSLAIEVGYCATGGSRRRRRTEYLVRNSMRLSQEVQRPHALALSTLTAGVAAYLEGSWSQGLERLERAEELLRERCTGVTWELNTAVLFQLRCRLFQGSYAVIERRLPQLLREVQERGDLYAETNLRSRVTWVVWLVRDEPTLAEEEVSNCLERWSQQGFHLQHYWHMIGTVEVGLYTGHCVGAWRALQPLWQQLESSLLLRIELTRLEGLHVKARCALAAAVQLGPEGGETAALLRTVARTLRALRKPGVGWSDALADLVEAGVLAFRGRRKASAKLLEKTVDRLEELDMALYAVAARRRLGQLRSGEAGALEVAKADGRMAEEGIKNPGALADVLVPGGWAKAKDS